MRVDSLDDIVFEKRNKNYGAYFLRLKYFKHGIIAFAFSLFVVIAATCYPLILNYFKSTEEQIYIEKELEVEFEDIKKIEKPEQKTENADKIYIPDYSEQKLYDLPDIISEIVGDYVVVDTLIETEDAIIIEIIDLNNELELEDFEIEDSFSQIEETEEELEIAGAFFLPQVQQKPVFEAGIDSLMNFISNNIIYPEKSYKGTVYVTFIINSSGNVEQAQVVRGLSTAMDAEAVRVISSLPQWIPAKNKGSNVSVWYTLPVKFR